MKKEFMVCEHGEWIMILHATKTQGGTFQWFAETEDGEIIRLENETGETIPLTSRFLSIKGKKPVCKIYVEIASQKNIKNREECLVNKDISSMVDLNRFEKIKFWTGEDEAVEYKKGA